MSPCTYIALLSFQLSEGHYIFCIPHSSWYMEDTQKSLEKERKEGKKGETEGGGKEGKCELNVKNMSCLEGKG